MTKTRKTPITGQGMGDEAKRENTGQPYLKSRREQRQRLLRHLSQVGPIDTLAIRSRLDIASPAPRVFELRRQGVEIETEYVWAVSQAGTRHLVARYSLKNKAA